jgi:hypothetical protein
VGTPIVIDVAAGNSRTIRQGSIGCGAAGGSFVPAGALAAINKNASAAAPWAVRWDELRAVEGDAGSYQRNPLRRLRTATICRRKMS